MSALDISISNFYASHLNQSYITRPCWQEKKAECSDDRTVWAQV